MPLVNSTQLAQRLNTTTRQINTWYTRRARNGFPEPERVRDPLINSRVHDQLKRSVHLWDEDKVVSWHKDYVPAVGGRRSVPRT